MEDDWNADKDSNESSELETERLLMYSKRWSNCDAVEEFEESDEEEGREEGIEEGADVE